MIKKIGILWMLMGLSAACFGERSLSLGSLEERQLQALSVAYEDFKNLPEHGPVVIYGSIIPYLEKQVARPIPHVATGKVSLDPREEWRLMFMEGEHHFAIWIFCERRGVPFTTYVRPQMVYIISQDDFQLVDPKTLVVPATYFQMTGILSEDQVRMMLVAYQNFKALPEVAPRISASNNDVRRLEWKEQTPAQRELTRELMDDHTKQMLLDREPLLEGQELKIALDQKTDGNLELAFWNSKIISDFTFGGGAKVMVYTVSRETFEIIEKNSYYSR